MKKWILFIFEINKNLESLCQKQDRYIENYALSVKGKPMDAYYEVLRRLDIKVRLINLRVLHDKFCDILTEEEADLFFPYLDGAIVEDICKGLSFSRATAFRKIAYCFEKCESVLWRLGFDEARLEQDYAEFYHLIHNAKKPWRKEQEDLLQKRQNAEGILEIKPSSPSMQSLQSILHSYG